MNIPQDDGDLNAQYEAEVLKFSMKPPKEVQVISEEDRQADYYKGFRSAVVLAWVFCNFALGAVVLSAAGLETFDTTSTTDGTSTDETQNQRSLIYMEVVLWSVAGLSMFKFMGATWYLIVRMVSFPSIILRIHRTPLTPSSSEVFDFISKTCLPFSLFSSIFCFNISHHVELIAPEPEPSNITAGPVGIERIRIMYYV